MDNAFIAFCAALAFFLIYQSWRIAVAFKNFNAGTKSHIDALLLLNKARLDVESSGESSADQDGKSDQVGAA